MLNAWRGTRVVQVSFGVVALALSASPQEPLFPAPAYVVSGSPQSITTGDVNADGLPDLVVGSSNGDVHVLLAQPGGSFVPSSTPSSQGQKSACLLLDVDHDGHIDLVTANQYPSSLSLFYGDGAGGFSAELKLPDPYQPSALAVGDLDGNQLADLVVAHQASEWFWVYLGDSAGGFSAPLAFFCNQASQAVDVADMNADGRDDVVIGTQGTSASVFLNSGLGFHVPVSWELGGGPWPTSILAMDASGDGKLDIVAAADYASVLLNVGLGFVPAAAYQAGGDANDVALMDLDGDDWIDMLVASPVTQGVFAFPGTGGGAFGPPTPYLTGSGAVRLAAADFDADTRNDVAVTNSNENTVTVMAGDGLGALQGPHIATGFGPYVERLAVGDLDGDGLPDVVAVRPAYADLAWGLNDGSGIPPAPTSKYLGQYPADVAVADVTGDGNLDALVSLPNSWSIVRYAGDGAGQFPSGPIDTSGVSQPQGLVAADLDGDDVMDLAAAGGNTDSVTVLRGDGAGGLTPTGPFWIGLGYAESVAAGDVNLDGQLDLALSRAGSGHVSVLLGTGSGTMGSLSQHASGGTSSRSVALADLDQDGDADLLTANQGSNDVSVLVGNGQGAFVAGAPVAVGSSPTSIGVADFDGDFELDVVVANSSAATVSVLLGDGSGALLPEQRFVIGRTPVDLVPADMDGDRRIDLVAACQGSQGLGILLNQAGFAAPVLESVEPDHGLFNVATPVTLAGAHFEPLAPIEVLFGGAPATDVAWVSETQVTCVAPPGPQGQSVDVTLVQNGVATTLEDAFTYEGTLVLGLDLAAGNVTGGVTATASILYPTTAADTTVTLGGAPATVLDVTPGGEVSFVVPATLEPTGVPVDLVVSNGNGTDTLEGAFLYTPVLSASASGSVSLGGLLTVDWVTDPDPAQEAIWMWLDNPLLPDPLATLPAFAGVLHTDALFMVLPGFPGSIHPLALSFGPLHPSVAGIVFSVQAVATGEGGPKGSFTNPVSFVLAP